MECDELIEIEAARVLESILLLVNSGIGSLHESKVRVQGGFLLPQTMSSTLDSFSSTKSDSSRKGNNDEIIEVNNTSRDRRSQFGAPCAIFHTDNSDNGCRVSQNTSEMITTDEGLAKPTNNAYDECHLLIKVLLNSLESETSHKDDSVESVIEYHSSQSVLNDPAELNQRVSTFTSEKPTFRNSSPFCCQGTVSTINVRGSPCSSKEFMSLLDKDLNCSHDFDSDIESFVDELFSNDARTIQNTPFSKRKCSSKKGSRPKLQTANLVQNGVNSNAPTTPECSDNFAELKLCSSSGKRTPENTNVPSGWLSTLNSRKQRSDHTNLRAASRKEDFVCCGPTRDPEIHEDEKISTISKPCLKLRTPDQASDVPADLLHSGIAYTPGTCDKEQCSLVIIAIDDILWEKCDIGAISLARFLLYLTSKLEKITFIIDDRNSNLSLFTKLLEALSIFQSNSKATVCRVILLSSDADSNIQDLLKSLFKCECITFAPADNLSEYVQPCHLPMEFGGTNYFSQASWAQCRLMVDSFVSFCENVRHNFAREIISMTSQTLPPTVEATNALLTQHHKDMSHMLDDRQVANLRDRGQRILQQLSEDGGLHTASCASLVQSSFDAADDAVSRFVQVGDDRLVILERHLLVKQFEQSCDYICAWYTNTTKSLTDQFAEIPDSFEDLREQRMNFDRFYMDAMADYAKCDCMLSEVDQLNRLGYLCEVELVQRAKISEEQVQELVMKMERKKEEIEINTQMYRFIDQAYSWALDGMKFVAMLNMEECLTLEACQQVIDCFDDYMDKHPPMEEKDFSEILNLASRHGNTKCMRQCEFAQQKCRETSQLFTKRRELIAKVKDQIRTNGKKRVTSFKMKSRDKLERRSSSRSKSPETNPASANENSCVKENRTFSMSSDDSFLETISNRSSESSGFDELSQHTILSSTSSNFTEMSEINLSSKSNQKPARKILKKSTSMPSHQLARTLSHVHSQSGATLSIGSPVPLQDELNTPGKSKLALIVEELISTEREYARSLNYVIENYFPEMKRLDIPQALRCKGNIIFGNIEKIAEFHSGYFLRDLEKCDGNPLLVAKTFQANKENFGLYALYSKNKPQSDKLLREHGNKYFKTKQLELEDKMDLASYLLKPVQRMGKYALLLHAMSKRASPSDERSLRDAEELVKFQLRHGNDLLTMDSIQDCDVNLKEQGNLLRQDQFVMFSGRKKIMRRVFLFEDLILFSKPVHVHGGHDVYQYKGSYKTTEIGMTENIGDSGFKFEVWFRRRRPQTTQDRFILQGTSRGVKRAWVEEIRNLLWKQALKNKDHRKMEMSSMGVGSKPHLDLAVSNENRILDRAVASSQACDSHTLADRLVHSRCRSSIAVSTFDHANQQNKRPHSTISTSSSASSVGSGNNPSGSIVSSLTLASWPPKCDMKTSNMSGPPMAYCDFHAIAENLNEDCETSSESSSVTTLHSEHSDVSNKSTVNRQYVTTPNVELLVT